MWAAAAIQWQELCGRITMSSLYLYIFVLLISVYVGSDSCSFRKYCHENINNHSASQYQRLEIFIRPHSVTDSSFLYIFKEVTPLYFFVKPKMNGLGCRGLTYARFGFLCMLCSYSRSYMIFSRKKRHFFVVVKHTTVAILGIYCGENLKSPHAK